MIRHIVAVNFADGVDEAAITNVMDELGALREVIAGISDFQHRANVSPEDHAVRGFRHLFWFDFDNEQARDAYLVDPRHMAVGARLVTMAQGGIDGILVLDFQP